MTFKSVVIGGIASSQYPNIYFSNTHLLLLLEMFLSSFN